MKDLDPIEHNVKMATTTLDRIPTLHFPSEYSYGSSSTYSIDQSYPDHTDWGPTHPNPDELAAAIAIAQLSRTKGRVAPQISSRNMQSSMSKPREDFSSSDDSEDDFNAMKENPLSKSCDMDSSVAIKCEPVDEDDVQIHQSSRALEARTNDARTRADNDNHYSNDHHYVRTCQYLDVNSNECNNVSVVAPMHQKLYQPVTMLSPRIVLTAADTANHREASPDDVADELDQSNHFKPQNAARWSFGNSGQLLLPERPRQIVSPRQHHYSPRLFADSRCPSSSSINLPPTRAERISPDSIGYQYQFHSESQPSLNSSDLYSQSHKFSGSGRQKRRFETPTSFLKRKVQYNVDQARRRYYSDDSGQVRQRILEGRFGSLSAIEAYYKQFEGDSKRSRLSFDDSAMDLSINKGVNNERLASDDICRSEMSLKTEVGLITNGTTSRLGRSTHELAMAFKLFQLNGAQQAAVDDNKTTTVLQQCSTVKHHEITTSARVNGLIADLEHSTTAARQKLNQNNRTVLTAQYELIDSRSAQKRSSPELTRYGDKLEFSGETSPSRKSRSPTFQLPDNQLPPKKRRIFDQCKEGSLSDGEENIAPINRAAPLLSKENYQTASKEVLSQHHSTARSTSGVDNTNHSQEFYNELSRDSSGLLSAVRPDQHGDLPLHIAVVRGMTSVVERLIALMLKLNIPIDTCNNEKQTAVHLAVVTNQPQAVNLLLTAGACPSLTDRQGNHVGHLAVQHNSMACLKVLLERCRGDSSSATLVTPQLDLNAKNSKGMSPIHLAVQLQRYDALRALIEARADIDVTEDQEGRTALYLALESDDLMAAKILLERGANPIVPTHSGSSAALLAARRYNFDMMKAEAASGEVGR